MWFHPSTGGNKKLSSAVTLESKLLEMKGIKMINSRGNISHQPQYVYDTRLDHTELNSAGLLLIQYTIH